MRAGLLDSWCGERCRKLAAFTLLELLVSMALVAILMVALVSITDYTRKTSAYTSARIDQFQGAQAAFDAITSRLSRATLNTYWDYTYPNGDTTKAPTGYERQSGLRFISGQASSLVGPTNGGNSPTHAMFFQAPLGYVEDSGNEGLSNLLNTWGYFVEFGSDSPWMPDFLSGTGVGSRHRFRLMELMEPSDSLNIYNYTSGKNGVLSRNASYDAKTWFTDALNRSPRPAHVLAENVIALIILPKLSSGAGYPDGSLAPDYAYDSTDTNANPNLNPRNQLPPVVQVTMVVVDETTFSRFLDSSTSLPTELGLGSLFQTVGDTTDPGNPGYAKDLKTLEETLQEHHIKYRIFSTAVSLKAAKWSRAQAN